MSTEVIGFLGAILCLSIAAVAAFYGRKAGSLQSILVEAASRFEATRKRLQEIEQQFSANKARLDTVTEAKATLERHLEEARGRMATHAKQIEAVKQGQQLDFERVSNRADNFGQQVAALTAQLVELDTSKRELKARCDELERDQGNRREQRETLKKDNQEREQLVLEVQKTRERLSESERDKRVAIHEAEKLRAIFKMVDPAETKKAKQRLAHLEQLYTSMKGLREMAEERTENWQVALRLLSLHIVGPQAQHLEIGPLVGAALESIGAHLVVDEHVPTIDAQNNPEHLVPTPETPANAAHT